MKTALISGGTQGIGKGAVLELLEKGFRVSVFSNDPAGCKNLARELSGKFDPKKFLILEADVRNENALKKIVQETVKKFGSIDVLFNNAGFGYFADCDAADMDRFQEMLQVNLFGLALLTKLVVPHMKKRKSGLILNIASISGKKAFANGEFYSAAKFGVMGYSEGIRNELKPFGIKVCTLCPGMVKTNFFTPEELERRRKALGIKDFSMLEVEDISKIIGFICTQAEHCDIQDLTVMPF